MSHEDALYSGPNGPYNITEYLDSVPTPLRQRGHTIPTQSRDSAFSTTAYGAQPVPLSDTLPYAQLATQHPHTSIYNGQAPWGATTFYANQGQFANPDDHSATSNGNGETSTYYYNDDMGRVLPGEQRSSSPSPPNPWASVLATPRDGLNPTTYTLLPHVQIPPGYYPLPFPPGALLGHDATMVSSVNGFGEPVDFMSQRPVSNYGSDATMTMDTARWYEPGNFTESLDTKWNRLQRYLYTTIMESLDNDLDYEETVTQLVDFTDFDKVNDPEFSLGYKTNIQPTPLSEFKDAVVGVEATAYLQNLIDEGAAHEPLLAALGGDPIGLKHHIKNDLDKWKENSIRPFFVFDGQSIVGKDEMALRNARSSLLKTQSAWTLYGDHQPNDAVKAFGSSGAVRVQDLYRVLQEVLAERNMEFVIAPFSACAQLIYLLYLDVKGAHIIDTVMGSKELLLYDKSQESMLVHPPSAEDWENKSFRGIFRSEAIEKLGVTSEMLDDALLMVGTSFLPPFPPLLQIESIISVQPFTLVDAINLLRTSEKSVTSTCAAFQDILEKRDPKWLDKYRKAKMAVKHAIIVQENGTIISRDYDNLTGDNNEYLGLQLPPELYFYLSKALIGPRIMNYFISLESVVFPTLDGVDSEEYRYLVTESLLPLKEMTTALIASRIHRVFQNKNITIKYWFDDKLSRRLEHKNILSVPSSKADTWKVLDPELKRVEKTLNVNAGSLSFAALALQDKDFPSKTIFKDSRDFKEKIYLSSTPEILSSVLWRLLHLRGYVNDKHELTNWGKALAVTLKSIDPMVKQYKDIHQLEEAAFLAFELIQFENLNSKHRHTELIGGPLRGSDEDKANCILIGRTACLLKLRHKNVGYTGPLSKNFLAYHSLVKAVRETDRDLVEGIVASMLLSDQIDRLKSRNYGELGRSLPFSKAVNTIFGIAVTTYLDDFLKPEWTAEERTSNKAHYAEKFVPHSVNFVEDLDVAFKFFDAVYAGVKTLSNDELPEADRQAWDGAKAYLERRR